MEIPGQKLIGLQPTPATHDSTPESNANADPVKAIIESISPAEWQSICNCYSTNREIFEGPAWSQTQRDLSLHYQSDEQKGRSVYLYSGKIYESTGKHGAGDKVCIFVFNESNFSNQFTTSKPPPLGTLYSAKPDSFLRAVWRGINLSANPPVAILTDDINLLSSGQNTICSNGFNFQISRLDEDSKRRILDGNRLINHTAPASFFSSTITRGVLESKEERLERITLVTEQLKAHQPTIIRLNGFQQARFFKSLETELNRKMKEEGLASQANTALLRQWLGDNFPGSRAKK